MKGLCVGLESDFKPSSQPSIYTHNEETAELYTEPRQESFKSQVFKDRLSKRLQPSTLAY